VGPGRTHWYERAPVVSRLMTKHDHMRDILRAPNGHWEQTHWSLRGHEMENGRES
jgi:hypothetical protein